MKLKLLSAHVLFMLSHNAVLYNRLGLKFKLRFIICNIINGFNVQFFLYSGQQFITAKIRIDWGHQFRLKYILQTKSVCWNWTQKVAKYFQIWKRNILSINQGRTSDYANNWRSKKRRKYKIGGKNIGGGKNRRKFYWRRLKMADTVQIGGIDDGGLFMSPISSIVLNIRNIPCKIRIQTKNKWQYISHKNT